MGKRPNTKDIVREFMRGEDRILVLPFDGLRDDVSKHWHRFLEMTLWRMLKKALVLALTRSMHSGSLKNALLRSIGIKIGKNVFIAALQCSVFSVQCSVFSVQRRKARLSLLKTEH